MTALQDRLFAGRCLQAARAQEELARSLRPGAGIPAQRASGPESETAPVLTVVAPAEPESAQ